ncbi:hypothetical protein, partial [Pseudomonas aeruginosa]
PRTLPRNAGCGNVLEARVVGLIQGISVFSFGLYCSRVATAATGFPLHRDLFPEWFGCVLL